MSQSWTDDVFSSGHTAQTDLQNIENNFVCLKSSFSGIASPSSAVVGQLWFETDNGSLHKGLMKYRNGDNDDWLTVMPCDNGNEGGGAKGYIWLYRNNTVDGMIIDTTVSDRVLAVKGGSNAYNVNGGNAGGTWTQPDHAHAAGAHTHPLSASGNAVAQTDGMTFPANLQTGITDNTSEPTHTHSVSVTGTATAGSGNTGNGATASTYRPAAAVGTLQRPDL